VNFFLALKKDCSGQATTEYILLLTVIVGFVMLLAKFLKPLFRSLGQRFTTAITHQLFSGDLSTFSLGK